jgi:hypothetical protein
MDFRQPAQDVDRELDSSRQRACEARGSTDRRDQGDAIKETQAVAASATAATTRRPGPCERRQRRVAATRWSLRAAAAVFLSIEPVDAAEVSSDTSWANVYTSGYAGRSIVKAGAPPKKPTATNGDHGSEIDTEHIFGFTHGTDIGAKGELEFEAESFGAIGKRHGRYFATSDSAFLKYTLTDNFRVAAAVNVMTHDIRDVPGFDDRRQAAVAGGFMEFRYRILDREKAPFGLTFSFEPGASRIDELTGARVEQYAGEFSMLMDKEIIHNRLYGALNYSYDLSATRLRDTGEWAHDSALAINMALAYQFAPGILIGAEARYARQYEGLGLDRFKGEALYLGPTFFVKIGKHAALSGAWNVQVAGRAVDEPGRLDLLNFERHQALLRLNILLNAQ